MRFEKVTTPLVALFLLLDCVAATLFLESDKMIFAVTDALAAQILPAQTLPAAVKAEKLAGNFYKLASVTRPTWNLYMTDFVNALPYAVEGEDGESYGEATYWYFVKHPTHQDYYLLLNKGRNMFAKQRSGWVNAKEFDGTSSDPGSEGYFKITSKPVNEREDIITFRSYKKPDWMIYLTDNTDCYLYSDDSNKFDDNNPKF